MPKPLLLLLPLLLAANAHVIAQDAAVETAPRPRHEIYAGYGVLSFPALMESLTGIFGNAGKTKRGYGPVQVGYNYLLSEKWSIGVLGSYTSFTSRYTDSGDIDYRHRYYSVMPRVDGYWVRQEKLLLYSGIAVGTCAYRDYDDQTGETDKYSSVAGHLNVFGMRIRAGKKTGFFTEFGYGFNGLINVGVNARF